MKTRSRALQIVGCDSQIRRGVLRTLDTIGSIAAPPPIAYILGTEALWQIYNPQSSTRLVCPEWVTKTSAVGSLVRAMQKSGLPIAERPNLLLKGSGRVNRILGPDEELAGPLEKSLRQARKRRQH
jgi:hypothetical protein